jgi:hypothetical protein
MEKEKDVLKEEVSEIKEEVAEIKEEVAELITEQKKEKTKINLVPYLTILILVVAVVVVVVLDYPKISSFIKSKTNPYGFDYNYKKITAYDWDTILTEKKIAGIWNTSRKNINSAKNPDWSWVLEDPKQFVDEAKCATMLDEKILDQENQDKKNLLNVSILLCKNIDETKSNYSSRKDEIKNVNQSDNTVTLKNMADTKGLGQEGYTYSIEKASGSNGAAPDKFAGTVYREGPFMIMIDESEQQGTSYLSSNDMELKIAKYLDKQLQNLLAWD